MKRFCFTLIGFLFLGISLNIFGELTATSARPPQKRDTHVKHVVAKGQPAQKRAHGKQVAKGKQAHKSAAGAHACTAKDIVRIVKGAGPLAKKLRNPKRVKLAPALGAAYKKMLTCYSHIKGKAPKAIPKPLQSFAKGLHSVCAKRGTNKDLAEVFAKTCNNTSAGAHACTTKDIVTVAHGSKLLAHGKGSQALKAAYKKMLTCYSHIKGKDPKAIPKPFQSFTKGLHTICAKRNTPEMKKVFARTCGHSKVKIQPKKRKAASTPSQQVDDDDDVVRSAEDGVDVDDDVVGSAEDVVDDDVVGPTEDGVDDDVVGSAEDGVDDDLTTGNTGLGGDSFSSNSMSGNDEGFGDTSSFDTSNSNSYGGYPMGDQSGYPQQQQGGYGYPMGGQTGYQQQQGSYGSYGSVGGQGGYPQQQQGGYSGLGF